MKLHIECLQEKLDQVQKENQEHKEAEETKRVQEGKKHQQEIDKLHKVLKQLEDDLNQKSEKLRAVEAMKD